jgi:hypothetical protein
MSGRILATFLCMATMGCAQKGPGQHGLLPAAMEHATSPAAGDPTKVPLQAGSAVPSAGSASIFCIGGVLTQKGSPPEVFWAITDRAGKVWKIVNPAQAGLPGKSQSLEAGVAGIGWRVGGMPFDGIQVADLRPSACPAGVAGLERVEK